MKILVVYGNYDYPIRKSIESLLYCYRKYSEAQVYYCNISVRKYLSFLDNIEYDIILFSHSISVPWVVPRYLKMLRRLKKNKLRAPRKVAMFQDEFSKTDLMCQFVRELGINEIWSVAPKTEWPKIYKDIPENCSIYSYLTGYVDEEDVQWVRNELKKVEGVTRSIDVGYRTGWFARDIFRLGHWGFLKQKIGQVFLEKASHLKLDIQIGSGFFKGHAWLQFLMKCRYTLGVESGASLHDPTGEIANQIKTYLKGAPDASFEEIQSALFSDKDGNLNLKAISPRIFEAAFCETAMVLIEGEYQGILVPGRHYIALKEDFSNIEQVLIDMENEDLRRNLVENTRRDLIESGKYTYRGFVERFLRHSKTLVSKGPMDTFLFKLNILFEQLLVIVIIFRQMLRRLK